METTEYRIPAVALRGMVVLPEMVTHFDVSRSRSIKAVEQALSQKQNLFVVTQQDPDTDAPEQEPEVVYLWDDRIGTVANGINYFEKEEGEEPS